MGKKILMKALVCAGFGFIGAADSYAALKQVGSPTTTNCGALGDEKRKICQDEKAKKQIVIDAKQKECNDIAAGKPTTPLDGLVPPPIDPNPVRLTMCLDALKALVRDRDLKFAACMEAAYAAEKKCMLTVTKP